MLDLWAHRSIIVNIMAKDETIQITDLRTMSDEMIDAMATRWNPNPKAPRTVFRFRNMDHYQMVKECAANAGLSINAWIVQLTLATARRKLGRAAAKS